MVSRISSRASEGFCANHHDSVTPLADHKGVQFDYVQRSPRFRFPDIITVRFIPVSPSRSTLAIYSRSVYGRRDFGVNEKRVQEWMALILSTL